MLTCNMFPYGSFRIILSPLPAAAMLWAIALFQLAAPTLFVPFLIIALTQAMTLFWLAAPYSSLASLESTTYRFSLLYPPPRSSSWAGLKTAYPPSQIDHVRCPRSSCISGPLLVGIWFLYKHNLLLFFSVLPLTNLYFSGMNLGSLYSISQLQGAVWKPTFSHSC